MTRIIGIDPGSCKTGFGIIELDDQVICHVINGLLQLGNGDFSGRLKQIFVSLTDIIQRYKLDMMVVEKVFVHKNVDSALKLGQARGAAICAGVSQNLSIHEYSATQIKKAVVGKGHAKKEQVQFMMSVILNLPEVPVEDAADALACAVTHARFVEIDGGKYAQLPSDMRTSRRRGRYNR